MLLAGGRVAGRTLLAFLLLHVLLYGGANAFNTYYDRDTGPIGGLERPPPVRRELLPWSLGLQATGFPLALLVSLRFAAIYLTLFLLFTAYSHPAVRIKRRPWWSLAAIGLGQGGLGFLAGWTSVLRNGDAEAAKSFLGADCGLCGDPEVAIETKNLR